MDARLRRLEQAATAGDPEAVAELDAARLRAGVSSTRARELLAHLGDPGAGWPALESGQDVFLYLHPDDWRSSRSNIYWGLAEEKDSWIAAGCEDAPPRAALGLIGLLDELGVADTEEHAFRHLLAGRWALGIGAWGHEAAVRAGVAALRCVPLEGSNLPAFQAAERWTQTLDPQDSAGIGAALRGEAPDFSHLINVAHTGNTDAMDEAREAHEAANPVRSALGDLCYTFTCVEEARAQYAATAVGRLRSVPAETLVRALQTELGAWAREPEARLDPPPANALGRTPPERVVAELEAKRAKYEELWRKRRSGGLFARIRSLFGG